MTARLDGMDTAELPSMPFTRRMAAERGISRHRLAVLTADHEVRQVLTGVYLRADVEENLEVRIEAASLMISKHAVVCDRTAAWIWGVDTFEFRELEILPPLETYVLRGKNRTRRRLCDAGGVRDLEPCDIELVHGFKVTTPLRTVLDLACKLSRRDALAALDGFMRIHNITTMEMKRELVRYFRRRGVVQARALVNVADPRSESPGESWTRLEIIDHGLPRPQLQWWVLEGGRKIYRLDLCWPKSKVVVEYDGQEFHGEDRRVYDEARREWLRRRGWIVIVVTKDDFTPEGVDAWIGEIREGLRLRAA